MGTVGTVVAIRWCKSPWLQPEDTTVNIYHLEAIVLSIATGSTRRTIVDELQRVTSTIRRGYAYAPPWGSWWCSSTRIDPSRCPHHTQSRTARWWRYLVVVSNFQPRSWCSGLTPPTWTGMMCSIWWWCDTNAVIIAIFEDGNYWSLNCEQNWLMPCSDKVSTLGFSAVMVVQASDACSNTPSKNDMLSVSVWPNTYCRRWYNNSTLCCWEVSVMWYVWSNSLAWSDWIEDSIWEQMCLHTDGFSYKPCTHKAAAWFLLSSSLLNSSIHPKNVPGLLAQYLNWHTSRPQPSWALLRISMNLILKWV